MGKEIEVEKHKFDQYTNQISIKYVNIDRIVASNKVLFGKKGFKYSIGYEDGKKSIHIASKNECL